MSIKIKNLIKESNEKLIFDIEREILNINKTPLKIMKKGDYIKRIISNLADLKWRTAGKIAREIGQSCNPNKIKKTCEYVSGHGLIEKGIKLKKGKTYYLNWRQKGKRIEYQLNKEAWCKEILKNLKESTKKE